MNKKYRCTITIRRLHAPMINCKSAYSNHMEHPMGYSRAVAMTYEDMIITIWLEMCHDRYSTYQPSDVTDGLFWAQPYAAMRRISYRNLTKRKISGHLIHKAWHATGTTTDTLADVCAVQNTAKRHTTKPTKEKAAKRWAPLLES